MYERILAPLDGSGNAEIVLPYAEEIAAKFGAEIDLVSVAESGTTDVRHLLRSYLEHITEQVVRDVREWSPVKELAVNIEVLAGKPADQIVDYAGKAGAGLIVLANRGSSGQGPWFLGSTAAKILRATEKPVLLVRAAAGEKALRQRRLIKRILLPLDGSDTGEAAIPHAEMLAKILGAELVLFEVVEPEQTWSGEVSYPTPEKQDRRKLFALPYLEGAANPLKRKGLAVGTAVAIGSPADQIIDYAKANAIDLIAMSTHGHSGMGRWVFGSVTDKVLHAGETPVLVVRASAKATP
ncbi:MAG: universal stress protein [Dehalococcoidales bacterium]|nr:universal stress protein [Dehalococcoidales bacterium]